MLLITAAELPAGPDAVTAWIAQALLIRHVVDRRAQEGPTLVMDEILAGFVEEQTRIAWRLVN